jgi:hypothetical protein
MTKVWKIPATLALVALAAGPAIADVRGDRGIDPEDPAFGAAVTGAMTAMTGAISRAVHDVRNSGAFPLDRGRPAIADEETAVNACAVAAQDEARGFANIAVVEDIVDVDRTGDGWDVEGTVETRQGYRDSRREEWRFSCSVRAGVVADVYIEDAVALR